MARIRAKIGNLLNFVRSDEIWQDDAKYTLLVSKIILNLVNFWPEHYNIYTRISFYGISLIYVLIQMSLLVHLVTSTEGVVSLTRSMSTFALGMQITAKMSIVYLKWKELDKIIKTIRFEFWPSNILGKEIQHQIQSESKKLLLIYLIPYIGALIFLTQIILFPILNGIRILPYNSWYPFKWWQSPTYEILYVLEAYMTIFVNGNIVCGTDYLYCSICSNCMVQFRLICDIIKGIGDGNERYMILKLMKIPGVSYREVLNRENEDERKLLVICLKHHQKLLNICSQLNRLFNYGHFYQLTASMTGLCAVCYLITTENNANGQSFLASYFIAHVVQLLLYCGISNELSHWSEQLSIDAFQCAWYNRKYADIRRCLSILIMRSQKAISFKAIELFELSYASFLLTMRYTFSLYTFLDNFTEK